MATAITAGNVDVADGETSFNLSIGEESTNCLRTCANWMSTAVTQLCGRSQREQRAGS